ncbi:MAG: S-layer homology domain-containing protein [Tissierellia bacterium]|nr:S-layer homology domain-containing protein [Tissierellia bacterium]
MKRKAIEKVFGNKVVKGYPDRTFKPNQNITREEAVTILNGTFGRITESTSFSKVNIKEAKSFIDVFESDWYYYGVLDASTKHEVFKEKKDAVDQWTKIIY